MINRLKIKKIIKCVFHSFLKIKCQNFLKYVQGAPLKSDQLSLQYGILIINIMYSKHKSHITSYIQSYTKSYTKSYYKLSRVLFSLPVEKDSSYL